MPAIQTAPLGRDSVTGNSWPGDHSTHWGHRNQAAVKPALAAEGDQKPFQHHQQGDGFSRCPPQGPLSCALIKTLVQQLGLMHIQLTPMPPQGAAIDRLALQRQRQTITTHQLQLQGQWGAQGLGEPQLCTGFTDRGQPCLLPVQGHRFITGKPGDGTVPATIVAGAPFEDSDSDVVDGDETDNSVSMAGAAYVFRYDGSDWSQEAYLKAFNSGATDEFGYHAVENVCTVYDLWATVMHQLGLDHERLTYRYGGRDFRLTDVHGNVLHDILS